MQQVWLLGLALVMVLAVSTAWRSGRAAITPSETAVSSPPRPERPQVTVDWEDGRYIYRVNGVEKIVRGMGYNVLYVQRGLPPDERKRRLREDFQFLRSVGVNTLQSWQHPEVDAIHLDLAAEYGLDVIPYYHLPWSDDYSDESAREWHRQQMHDWMVRWREHPAVVMWGIGNETLLHGHTCETASPFAEFYVELVHQALGLDPARPVTYREAEEHMVPCFRDAFEPRGGPPKQFIYGMNFYTFRLDDVLQYWDEMAFDVPLFISEFAPIGVPSAERPEGFQRFWGIIEEHEDRVIGGAPYTWTTAGPEATDRLFGLVDDSNHPFDASLVRLSEMWGGTYGQPSSQQVTVPDLTTLSPAEARSALYAAGLDVRFEERSGLRRAGQTTVRRQTPRAGTVVPRGASVRAVVPSLTVPADNGPNFETLVPAARAMALDVTGEALESFNERLEMAREAVEAELWEPSLSALATERTGQLAHWRAWLETLAFSNTPEGMPFPGAENIVPVYANLSRFALRDPAAFAQAQTFAQAVLSEWLATPG